MPYQFAAGHNNAAGLSNISPQPACPEIRDGLVRVAGNLLTYEDGYKSTTLKWSRLTAAQMDSLFGQFSVSSSIKSVLCTIRLKQDEDRAFSNYNATLERPRGTYVLGYWENVTAEITFMDAL